MAISSNSTVNRAAFPHALASRAHRLGSDATIQQLIQDAEAQILGGGGEVSFLVSAGGNGKTAMKECRLDAAELFTLAEQALALYRTLIKNGTDADGGEAVSTTYTDFSGVSGLRLPLR